MTGEQINNFLEQMPEMNSIEEIANYLISNLRGIEGVSFYDVAYIFIEYTRKRKDLHTQIDYITIPEEFLREKVQLVNDIITGIYVSDTRVFEYSCPACGKTHQIEMTDEEYDRFLDILFNYGMDDGYRNIDEDDILYSKYKEVQCDCGASNRIFPNITFNGVYAI